MIEKYEKHRNIFNIAAFVIFWGILYLLCPEFGDKNSEIGKHLPALISFILAVLGAVFLTPILVSAFDSFAMFFGSPIFRKRWHKFKSLKRGYFSFLIIVTLFVLSFFAEFFINSNAIFVKYKGKVTFTLFSHEKAKNFGMRGYGQPNYRMMKKFYDVKNAERAKRIEEKKNTPEDDEYIKNNWGDDWVMLTVYPYGPIESLLDELPCRPPHPPSFMTSDWNMAFYEEALFDMPVDVPSVEDLMKVYGYSKERAEELRSYEPHKALRDMAIEGKFKLKAGVKNPEQIHILGTDDRGRDVFSRMVYGFRISLAFALITNLLSYIIGISIGALLGYYGGKFDIIMQRFIEIWSAMPFLYTVMIVAAIVVPNFWMLVCILVMFGWMGMTYYIRGEFLREKSKDYVAAAKAIGCTDSTIIFKHILPNSLTPVISFVPFDVIGGISSLVSLDFLGFGLPAPTPSWGELLGQGLGNLMKPWLIVAPTLAMFTTLLLVSFIGEAIREAFDPKQYSRLR